MYTYVAGGGKDFAKARTKVEVVDEAGGTKEEDRAVGLGREEGVAVRDESRGWKRGDSGSQRVKAAPSGRSMCVASARSENSDGTSREKCCRRRTFVFTCVLQPSRLSSRDLRLPSREIE